MLKRVVVFLLLFLALSAPGFCMTVWEDREPMTLFLSDYYGVDPIVVITLGQTMNKYDDDTSTALFIARMAEVDPMELMNERLRGMTWVRIMNKYDLDKADLFAGLNVKNAPGRFRYPFAQYEKSRSGGGSIEIYDDNIRDLVQIRLMKEAFGKKPLDVMKAVEHGSSFTALINAEIAGNEKYRAGENDFYVKEDDSYDGDI